MTKIASIVDHEVAVFVDLRHGIYDSRLVHRTQAGMALRNDCICSICYQVRKCAVAAVLLYLR
jgi:hypothetical protein